VKVLKKVKKNYYHQLKCATSHYYENVRCQGESEPKTIGMADLKHVLHYQVDNA